MVCAVALKKGQDLLKSCVLERRHIASAQEKAVHRQDSCCLFSVCSAVAFLSHHSHATSEQQAEKPPCLSLSGRVAAADLSHVSVPSHSLEGLVCSQSYSYPFLGCTHHLCTPVIFLCREVACFDTPFPSNILSSFCAGLCSQLSARHHSADS